MLKGELSCRGKVYRSMGIPRQVGQVVGEHLYTKGEAALVLGNSIISSGDFDKILIKCWCSGRYLAFSYSLS